MPTKKTCAEMEKWAGGLDRHEAYRRDREISLLKARYDSRWAARQEALAEVGRLLSTGVLIHRDDREGLAAALDGE